MWRKPADTKSHKCKHWLNTKNLFTCNLRQTNAISAIALIKKGQKVLEVLIVTINISYSCINLNPNETLMQYVKMLSYWPENRIWFHMDMSTNKCMTHTSIYFQHSTGTRPKILKSTQIRWRNETSQHEGKTWSMR